MRTLTLFSLTILAGQLLAPGRTLALGETIGTLRIINECDDAVEVSADELEVQFAHILEPLASVEEIVTSYGNVTYSSADITVTATLLSDPSLTTQRTVRVQNGETTTVRIQVQTKGKRTSLSIDTDGGSGKGKMKGKLAGWESRLSHDGEVALASTGGLGCLAVVALFLGRSPRRRSFLTDGESEKEPGGLLTVPKRSSGFSLLSSLPIVICLLTLTAGQAMAGVTPLNSTLQLINDTDDAVEVGASGVDIQVTHVLEPHSGVTEVILNAPAEILVTASLVSNPSIATQKTVRIKEQTRTTVRIQSRVKHGTVSLSMSVDTSSGGGGKGKGKGHVAQSPGPREGQIALASTGGLGLLMLLGSLFGRTPRRRQSNRGNMRTEPDAPTRHTTVRSSEMSFLRTLPMASCLMAVLVAPATATPPGGGGGGPGKLNIGTIKITNTCDEAVEVNVPSGLIRDPKILEPGASTIYTVAAPKPADVAVVATLVSDSTVTATAMCPVAKDKTTAATVSCSTTAAGVSLSIDCGSPQKSAKLIPPREMNIMVASSSGLGSLLLLGMLLGRRSRREDEISSAASA